MGESGQITTVTSVWKLLQDPKTKEEQLVRRVRRDPSLLDEKLGRVKNGRVVVKEGGSLLAGCVAHGLLSAARWLLKQEFRSFDVNEETDASSEWPVVGVEHKRNNHIRRVHRHVLGIAIAREDLAMVKLLVQYGASLSHQNREGELPVEFAEWCLGRCGLVNESTSTLDGIVAFLKCQEEQELELLPSKRRRLTQSPTKAADADVSPMNP